MRSTSSQNDQKKYSDAQHRPFIKESTASPIKIAFLLLENFSMASFTSSVDALVTANLLSETSVFELKKIGINSISVDSDINISVSTDLTLTNQINAELFHFDILVVCGGYRCSLKENPIVSSYISSAVKKKIFLASLWNGIIPIANARVMNGMICAVHPNNHSFMKEKFSSISVTNQTYVIGESIASSSGVNSAQEMMLHLIEKFTDKNLIKSIKQVLSCDKSPSSSNAFEFYDYHSHRLPRSLKLILKLMKNNIEEPLSIDDLTEYCCLSRRQIERLFKQHLNKTPSKLYLEIRLKHGKDLLIQSNESVTNIALASGFVTSSHFSNRFKELYGMSPRSARKNSGY
ncbi:helix-turn-helix domain-containing protein [Marinomonas sp. TI.3.20]|uniref:GlxA family transcriptional regulator n=1 Tax=Marinomonas sp. TI.3.20 TaxID=3121296 RepID=UPI00311F4EB4